MIQTIDEAQRDICKVWSWNIENWMSAIDNNIDWLPSFTHLFTNSTASLDWKASNRSIARDKTFRDTQHLRKLLPHPKASKRGGLSVFWNDNSHEEEEEKKSIFLSSNLSIYYFFLL